MDEDFDKTTEYAKYKYFGFGQYEDEPEMINFQTGYLPDEADDSPPEFVHIELARLLRPEFPDLDINAAESLHCLELNAGVDKVATETRIATILIADGWIEWANSERYKGI